MKNTYREGKYVLLVTEGSVDVDYIDGICKLLDQFGIEHRMEPIQPYPALERLVAYCNDETKWNMVEAYLEEYDEYWYCSTEEVA